MSIAVTEALSISSGLLANNNQITRNEPNKLFPVLRQAGRMIILTLRSYANSPPHTIPDAVVGLMKAYQDTLSRVFPETNSNWRQLNGHSQSGAVIKLARQGHLTSALPLLASAVASSWAPIRELNPGDPGPSPILSLPGYIPIDPQTGQPETSVPNVKLLIATARGLWQNLVYPLIYFVGASSNLLPKDGQIDDNVPSEGSGGGNKSVLNDVEEQSIGHGEKRITVVKTPYDSHDDANHRSHGDLGGRKTTTYIIDKNGRIKQKW